MPKVTMICEEPFFYVIFLSIDRFAYEKEKTRTHAHNVLPSSTQIYIITIMFEVIGFSQNNRRSEVVVKFAEFTYLLFYPRELTDSSLLGGLASALVFCSVWIAFENAYSHAKKLKKISQEALNTHWKIFSVLYSCGLFLILC